MQWVKVPTDKLWGFIFVVYRNKSKTFALLKKGVSQIFLSFPSSLREFVSIGALKNRYIKKAYKTKQKHIKMFWVKYKIMQYQRFSDITIPNSTQFLYPCFFNFYFFFKYFPSNDYQKEDFST